MLLSEKFTAKGHKKFGGRKKKTVREIREVIAKAYPQYEPILSMIEIGLDLSVDVAIRLAAHKEVAAYLSPKLKAVEHTIGLDPRLSEVRTEDLMELIAQHEVH